MSFHQTAALRAIDRPVCASAEELVITVYRCAIAGFSLGETECWDIGWRALDEAVPAGAAGALFGEFYSFVRALLAVAQNPLSWRPASCRGLTRDETLALAMIEAAQDSDGDGLSTIATMLLAADELGDALQAARTLARSLAQQGLFVRARRAGLLQNVALTPP